MSDAGTAAATATTAATTAATAAAAAATTPATLASDPAWAGFDDETRGTFTNMGLDKKTPTEAAAAALKSFIETKKHVGAPPELLVRLPKEPTDPQWKAIWERLGAGKAPEDYDLSPIKFTDGTELDDNFVSTMRTTLHQQGIPKDKAVNIVRDFVRFMEGVEANEAAERSAKVAVERDQLARSWGPNKEANLFIARQAVEKLGWDKEMVDRIENEVGYFKVMQALHTLGMKMGEDRFVASPNGMPGVMTREQAIAELNSKMADEQWAAKLLKGDQQAVREMDALTRLAA